MTTRVTSPKPQEIEIRSHDETIVWEDARGCSHTTKYRLQLKNQLKGVEDKVDALSEWVFENRDTHYVLIPKIEWFRFFNKTDQDRLVAAIQQASIRSFGYMTPDGIEKMKKQFDGHGETLTAVASHVFGALRYAAKESSTHSASLRYRVENISYRIDCHLKEKGSVKLMFIGGEFKRGQLCTVQKMIIMDIPKKLEERSKVSRAVYYRPKRPIEEKESIKRALEKIDQLKKQGRELERIVTLREEIKVWRDTIDTQRLIREQSIARGVEMAKVLKARRTPHVLEYLGHETKGDFIVAAMAEMCDGDARDLIPQQGQVLSVDEIKLRLDILKDIAETLMSLHAPISSPRPWSQAVIFCVCDLKTDNIFLKNNSAILGDLSGIVKEGDSISEFSLAYAAPGKALGVAARHEDDIYALGLIGYELLHGRFEHPVEVYAKLNEENPVDKLLKEMLEPNPHFRPTAAALRVRLEQNKKTITPVFQRSLKKENALPLQAITIGQSRAPHSELEGTMKSLTIEEKPSDEKKAPSISPRSSPPAETCPTSAVPQESRTRAESLSTSPQASPPKERRGSAAPQAPSEAGGNSSARIQSPKTARRSAAAIHHSPPPSHRTPESQHIQAPVQSLKGLR